MIIPFEIKIRVEQLNARFSIVVIVVANSILYFIFYIRSHYEKKQCDTKMKIKENEFNEFNGFDSMFNVVVVVGIIICICICWLCFPFF